MWKGIGWGADYVEVVRDAGRGPTTVEMKARLGMYLEIEGSFSWDERMDSRDLRLSRAEYAV